MEWVPLQPESLPCFRVRLIMQDKNGDTFIGYFKWEDVELICKTFTHWKYWPEGPTHAENS